MSNAQQEMDGGALPEDVRMEINRLQETIEREHLPRSARQEVVTTIRLAILPRQTRRADPRIDAAYADYQAGMRGLALYRKHIPNHATKGHYRRRADERRLMNSIHQRSSRERKAAALKSAGS